MQDSGHFKSSMIRNKSAGTSSKKALSTQQITPELGGRREISYENLKPRQPKLYEVNSENMSSLPIMKSGYRTNNQSRNTTKYPGDSNTMSRMLSKPNNFSKSGSVSSLDRATKPSVQNFNTLKQNSMSKMADLETEINRKMNEVRNLERGISHRSNRIIEQNALKIEDHAFPSNRAGDDFRTDPLGSIRGGSAAIQLSAIDYNLAKNE